MSLRLQTLIKQDIQDQQQIISLFIVKWVVIIYVRIFAERLQNYFIKA